MRASETTMTHEVFACPVCHQSITAEVTILPKLGRPRSGQRTNNSLAVPVTAALTRFDLHHDCPGSPSAYLPSLPASPTPGSAVPAPAPVTADPRRRPRGGGDT